MQKEIIIDRLEDFIGILREQGIARIVLAETNERRPVQVENNVLSVVPVRRAEIIAYRESVIYKCSLEDADFEALASRLAGEGFDVNRTSRNIT